MERETRPSDTHEAHWCWMRATEIDGLYIWLCVGCGRIERH